MISGLEAAYGQTGLKNDFPVAPYFVFGSVAPLSAAGDVRMLAHGGVFWSKADGAPSLADVFRFFDRRVLVFPRPAKSNACVYTRIEAALRAATADTNSVDLLAVSHVVQKWVQAQIDRCRAGSCPVITLLGLLPCFPASL
jgi:hypothetical protein